MITVVKKVSEYASYIDPTPISSVVNKVATCVEKVQNGTSVLGAVSSAAVEIVIDVSVGKIVKAKKFVEGASKIGQKVVSNVADNMKNKVVKKVCSAGLEGANKYCVGKLEEKYVQNSKIIISKGIECIGKVVCQEVH
ncbi:hypothetical protein ABPG74_021544 [Tetrahymena malaccensis]